MKCKLIGNYSEPGRHYGHDFRQEGDDLVADIDDDLAKSEIDAGRVEAVKEDKPKPGRPSGKG